MKPTRTGALALFLLGVVAVVTLAAVHSPDSENALPCPASDVRWVRSGWRNGLLAVCVSSIEAGTTIVPGPPAQALTVGLKLDLNVVGEAELALLPGVGRSLARAIVEERRRLGKFRSWDDVERVRGVGPAKAEVLHALTTVESLDQR